MLKANSTGTNIDQVIIVGKMVSDVGVMADKFNDYLIGIGQTPAYQSLLLTIFKTNSA